MNMIKTILSKAECLANNPARYWKKASLEVRAAALLVMQARGVISTPVLELMGERHDAPLLPWKLALAILSRCQSWELSSPRDADESTKNILNILNRYSYKRPSLTGGDVIAAYPVFDKYEANRIVEKIRALSIKTKQRTPLELGLIRALASWSSFKTFGIIPPHDLRALRVSLDLTQAQMAKELAVTLRQYARYESGETAVLKKKQSALKRLRLKATGSQSKGPAKMPKGAKRSRLNEYNVYVP